MSGWGKRGPQICVEICEQFAMKLSNTLAKSEIVFYEMTPSACSSAPPQNGIIQPCIGTRGLAGYFFCTPTIVSQYHILSPVRPPQKALRYVFFTVTHIIT